MLVRLEAFEGPLDLLLHLIHSHELDISKVSISKVTDQYLSAVKSMQDSSYDRVGEFLVLAATLLLWKSRSLLPADSQGALSEDEDLPFQNPEELVERLKQHKVFALAGEFLQDNSLIRGRDVFVRDRMAPPTRKLWSTFSITELGLSYCRELAFARKRSKVLKKETVSVADSIGEIAKILRPQKLESLDVFIQQNPARARVVVYFISALELAKRQKIRIYQSIEFGPISVELIAPITQEDSENAVLEFESRPA